MQELIILTRPEAKNKTLASILCKVRFPNFRYIDASTPSDILSNVIQNNHHLIVSLPALQLHQIPFVDLSKTEQESLYHLDTFDLIFCVSSSAADFFFQQLDKLGISLPERSHFACVGQASLKDLLVRGIKETHIICAEEGNDSEALLSALERHNVQLKRVLIVRGETGRDWFKEQLSQRGVSVQVLGLYRRLPSVLSHTHKALLASVNSETHVQWVLTSSESIFALFPQILNVAINASELSSFDVNLLKNHQFIVIHPRIGEVLKEQILQLTQGKVVLSTEQIKQVSAENESISAMLLTNIG